ncbi:MAG: metalloregulator ArsR/SmtB family transcription factor [Pseudomonadota bacterium]
MTYSLSTEAYLNILRAAGEATRLRLLVLFQGGELNVKDLTQILGQSQPRISRHLKILLDAELIERFQEGSWVYFRLVENNKTGGTIRKLLAEIDFDDPILVRDQMKAKAVKTARAEAAQSYFRNHAADWDKIRSLHVSEAAVEKAMMEMLGSGPFDVFVDLGTGTGRVLELFAKNIDRGIGVDINHDMLSYARSNLEKEGLNHCQVRFGDLFHLSFNNNTADVVVLHQVLHFLSDPSGALLEACRILKPGGKLLIVDFAAHDLEFLREQYAHQRLGFDQGHVKKLIQTYGLSLTKQINLTPNLNQQTHQLTVALWLASKPKTQPHSIVNNESQNEPYTQEMVRSMTSC